MSKMNFGRQRQPMRLPRKVVNWLLLAGLGVILAVFIPIHSQATTVKSPQKLALQGQAYYEAGQLDQAINSWQAAADGYQESGNQAGIRENYLNSATAQQALGLYTQSCDSLLSAFDLKKQTDCNQIIEQAQVIEPQLEGIVPLEKVADGQLVPIIAALNQQPDTIEKAQGLLRLGDYLKASGYPRVATKALEMSLQGTQQSGSTPQQVAALLSLGNAERAIALEQQNQFSKQTTVFDIVANSSATAADALATYQPALKYYQQASMLAPGKLDGLKAQLNHLSMLMDIQEYWQDAIAEFDRNLDQLEISDPEFLADVSASSSSLQQQLNQQLQPQISQEIAAIEPLVTVLPSSRGGIYARINYAESLIRHGNSDTATAQILAKAIKDSRQLNNTVAEAEATGYLGSLYEQEGQYSEARRLTENSLQLAPTAEHPEIAYRWNAQLGRILASQGNREQALVAYETSFNTIKVLRSDLATTPVEPIFREYISLLLQEEPDSGQLVQARDVLESLQVATLDNFFRDPCSPVAESPVAIDDVDRQAAVIYPILLQDRLEVILTLPGQPLKRYATDNLTREEVENTIKLLRRNALTNPGFAEEIRSTRGNPQSQGQVAAIKKTQEESLQQDILPLATQLYNWLVAPAAEELDASGVKTLVFVLDGALRNIPMALLYDAQEQKYLIEKDYNIALSSGLQLTAPQPLQRQPIKVLAAGVTSDFPAYRFPPIPKVEDELKTIKEIFGESEILLNQEFTESSLEQKLQESDFPIVHLATHGQFGSTADQTFILSGAQQGNPIINVNQFDSLLRSRNLRRSQPIELLVLSACNTAEGDEQAILGLAGVAVRAGARSTIATLWGANDEATSNLMGKFYRNLAQDAQISKARALRKAQLELLASADSQYRHPYYWAPFVLIGNWL